MGRQPTGARGYEEPGWEPGIQKQKLSELEVPWGVPPLTYLLLSPPNLLTFGKGEELQSAWFSRLPLPLRLFTDPAWPLR